MNDRPDALHKAIEAARLLRTNIAKLVLSDRVEAGEVSPEDAETIQDTFDGETTLDVELERALKAEDEDRILVDGIEARMKELTGRRERVNKRIEARRGLIEQAMIVAEWPSQRTAFGTLALSKSPDKVIIDDESLIPSNFWKRSDPVLSKSDLGTVLKNHAKELAAAIKLESPWAMIEALTPLLRRLPFSDQLNAEVIEAAKIEDQKAQADALIAIAHRVSPVPGAHLEIGGQHLIIRRK